MKFMLNENIYLLNFEIYNLRKIIFEIEFVYLYGYRNLLFAMLNKVQLKFVIKNYCITPCWTN